MDNAYLLGLSGMTLYTTIACNDATIYSREFRDTIAPYTKADLISIDLDGPNLGSDSL